MSGIIQRAISGEILERGVEDKKVFEGSPDRKGWYPGKFGILPEQDKKPDNSRRVNATLGKKVESTDRQNAARGTQEALEALKIQRVSAYINRFFNSGKLTSIYNSEFDSSRTVFEKNGSKLSYSLKKSNNDQGKSVATLFIYSGDDRDGQYIHSLTGNGINTVLQIFEGEERKFSSKKPITEDDKGGDEGHMSEISNDKR